MALNRAVIIKCIRLLSELLDDIEDFDTDIRPLRGGREEDRTHERGKVRDPEHDRRLKENRDAG
jgi:hypothetical protein